MVVSLRSQGKEKKRLKRGWTTGACATAAAKAAFTGLVTGAFPDPVRITLPKGQTPSFPLARRALAGGSASAAVIKDAGDDPDVTHGALIAVEIRPGAKGSGIVFKAGEGVGTVTREGLPLGVGEPAINPGPRRMIAAHIEEVARAHGASADVEVTVSVAGGEALAAKTWNPRLGIVGGISILGTTGLVIPYSCAAWIASIRQGIDVARAAGLDHVAACTGSTSEAAVRKLYGLPDVALLDMGDFVGGTLKYLRTHPVPKLTIAGGFAKIAKLADGNMDLHSKRSAINPARLADLARGAGAGPDLAGAVAAAESAGEILKLARDRGVPLGDAVAAAARKVAEAQARGAFDVEIIVYDRAGALVGRAPF